MKNQYYKWIVFAVIVITSIAADQATKLWASDRLANRTPAPALIDGPHHMQVDVPTAAAGKTVKEFLTENMTGTDPSEVDAMANRDTLIGEQRVAASRKLEGGETLTIQYRRVTVIPGYFHFRYTRNPGAAFGFLSKQDSDFRRPFFVGVSFLAIFVIMLIFRKVTPDQKLLAWSLSLIVGGAAGNLIDRVAYGWVIDFIDWHWETVYRWPTFNIADAAISIGVALMAVEIIIGGKEEEEDSKTASKAIEESGASS